MRPASLALAVLLTLTAGCRSSRPEASLPAPPAAPEEAATLARGDVRVDGVSVLGAWHAVEVVGDRQATRDLEDGALEQTLIVSSNGRVILTGVDHREGDGPVTFSGRITGNRVAFAGMEGSGTLLMSGRRLVLGAPDGRRTVFVRND